MVDNDKTSQREGGAANPHRLLLRAAALTFIFLGGLWLLLLVVYVILATTHGGLSALDLVERATIGLVPVAVGVLLYRVAPHLME